MGLYLAVVDGNIVVDLLCVPSVGNFVQDVIPKRDPDKKKGFERAWVIKREHRRKFGSYTIKKIESINRTNRQAYNTEELEWFFGLVGIGSRWADNDGVVWCLYDGSRRLKVGGTI